MNRQADNCLKLIRNAHIDALLVASPVNIGYLSGFHSGEGYMLISASGEVWYFTNFLYREAAKAIEGWQVVSSCKPVFTEIAQLCSAENIKNIGFEAAELSYTAYKNFSEKINAKGIKLVETKSIVGLLRAVKSPKEIVNIRKAIGITRRALEYAGEIYSGIMSEQALAVELERFMRLMGDNSVAFPTIVASGKNSAYPHHVPGPKQLRNESFLIDLGAKSCGYCGDLTRNFFSSKMPATFARVFDVVKKAQEIAIRKIKPGEKCSLVDKAARDYIDSKGYGKYFGHSLGHGVGLEVHELPYLGASSDQLLHEGMVVTVEPAIYLPGKFGVRIEDMVLVTSRGAEVLSR